MTTVGVLGGTGPAGRGVAIRLASAGYDIILGSRDEIRDVRGSKGQCPAVLGFENTARFVGVDVAGITFQGNRRTGVTGIDRAVVQPSPSQAPRSPCVADGVVVAARGGLYACTGS